jgi:serine/threonine protein phosphatase PrpC
MAEFWYSSSIGRRPTMEDVHVAAEDKKSGWLTFAVMDGHGGTGTVKRLEEILAPTVLASLARATAASGGYAIRPGYLRQLLKHLVISLDRRLSEDVKGRARGSGCTLILLVFNRRNRQIALANVGDSRAVLHMATTTTAPATPILVETCDHKPEDKAEMARVAQAGSFIERNRVAGILAMTRAMGDFSLKQTSAQLGATYDPVMGPVSALPDVKVGAVSLTSGALVVLGCDGIWDVMSSLEAVNLSQLALNEGSQPAKALVDEAYARGSTDNMTALVLRIPPYRNNNRAAGTDASPNVAAKTTHRPQQTKRKLRKKVSQSRSKTASSN